MSNSIKKIMGIALVFVMVFAMSAIPAFAADQDVTVNGSIGVVDDTGDPDPLDPVYSLTIPTSVTWYVTEYSYPDVWNTNATTDTTDPNEIVNTNTVGVEYAVSFEEFAQENADADTVASNLTLNLTGDLAADGVGALNLSGGYSTAINYTTTLKPGTANQWSFGFTGIYASTLTTTALAPEYTMTLGFALA